MKATRRWWGLFVVLPVVVVSGCAEAEDPEPAVVVAEVVEEVPEPPRVAPDWQQSASTADMSRCKVEDPRPESEKALFRGQRQGDIIGRENVGFPRTEREIPGLGEGNIIAAKVSFLDAPPSDEIPDDYLETQLAKLTEWSEFFSQGKFRYTFQIIPGWVEVPINHKDYPVDPGVGDNQYDQEEFYRQMNERMATIAKAVVKEFPDDLDYAGAHAIAVSWTPEMTAFKQSVSYREGLFQTPQGTQRIPFMSGGVFHTTTTGEVTFEVKKNNLWSWWAHDLLHFQGMNGHAPGNGWKTGVGQALYPTPIEYSGVLSAWETFLFEWFDDSQVFCSDLETLTEPQRVILTPLEIYAGERKMMAIRTVDYKLIVVESRRPIGYSETWYPQNSGLLVYEVDANGVHTDHLPDDCGNDRTKPKWAYYLYPDQLSGVHACDAIESVIVKEGMTLTHEGVKITLEFSDDELDYVLVEPSDG